MKHLNSVLLYLKTLIIIYILILYYRQISNTQWKKYVAGSNTVQEFNKGLEQLCNNTPKKHETRKNNPGSPMVSNDQGFSGVLAAASKRNERKTSCTDTRKDSERIIKTMNSQINGDAKKLQNLKNSAANFGYNKKSNSTTTSSGSSCSKTSKLRQEGTEPSSGIINNRHEGISHSLDRPRTKLKVSGGTQTTSDLHYMQSGTVHSDGEYSSNSLGRKYQKSYSLNGPTAAQLSQSLRERIMLSPYGKVSIHKNLITRGWRYMVLKKFTIKIMCF